MANFKEKERQLRHEISRLQTDLDKERLKCKTLSEKISQDNQQLTSLELRLTTQKSRLAELEGSLGLAHENANKVRQKSLQDQERMTSLTKELESSRAQIEVLEGKLVSTDSRLRDAERKTEALATLQSHRWMEFSKMADNMKELSHNMLSQSKTNTRKAAIRADLDEELFDP